MEVKVKGCSYTGRLFRGVDPVDLLPVSQILGGDALPFNDAAHHLAITGPGVEKFK